MRPRFNPQDVRGLRIPQRPAAPGFVRTTAPVPPAMVRTTAAQAIEEILERGDEDKLVFSNFHITVVVNTNAQPDEEEPIGTWLYDNCVEIFGSWGSLNDYCFKPAGTRNEDEIHLDDVNGIRVISVRTVIGLELGGARNHMHAHCMVEVAHISGNAHSLSREAPSGKEYKGVHVNVATMKQFFNERLQNLDIARHRIPEKIYLNCRLLTTGTDNSNKFLTVQYIGKTVARDNFGGERNLVNDRLMASAEDQRLHDRLEQFETENLHVDVNDQ